MKVFILITVFLMSCSVTDNKNAITKLEKRVAKLEQKVKQYHCPHIKVKFVETGDDVDPYLKQCLRCGKVVKRYWDKNKYMNDMILEIKKQQNK